MPFFEWEMLRKLLSAEEEKKIMIYINYLMFDIFSEKISFPTFRDRMRFFNFQKDFKLFQIFKEICGENKKYITLPRLVEAFMGYQMNSNLYSTELKNFFAFVNNELIVDYNDRMIGRVVQNMKEFSTKNMINRKSLTNIQIFANALNEIVGISLEYDDKYKNIFIAPQAKDKFHEIALNCQLNINMDFVDEEDRNKPELDHEYARDFVTHIYGTYNSNIESIGFKTAFGKNYFTGKPNKGKPFLVGSTKKKFHSIKFGMLSHLNYCTYKFIRSIGNKSLNTRIFELNDFDFSKVFDDELILSKTSDQKIKDQMIQTPTIQEKDFLSENFIGDDFVKGSLSEVEESGPEEEDDDNSENEEDQEKQILNIINKLSEDTYKNDLKKNLKAIKSKKQEQKKQKKKIKKEEENKKLRLQDLDEVNNDEFPNFDDDDLLDELINKSKNKGAVDNIRFIYAKEIDLKKLINNPKLLEEFINRYAVQVKKELDEKVKLQEKINAMKNDFYIRYLNKNKSPKDWELIDIGTNYDPIELSKTFNSIKKINLEYKFENEDIPDKKYKDFKIPLSQIKANWERYAKYINRKKVAIYLKQFLLSMAQQILVEYERGENYKTFDVKDKIIVYKLINKLNMEKKNIKKPKAIDKPKTEEEVEQVKVKTVKFNNKDLAKVKIENKVDKLNDNESNSKFSPPKNKMSSKNNNFDQHSKKSNKVKTHKKNSSETDMKLQEKIEKKKSMLASLNKFSDKDIEEYFKKRGKNLKYIDQNIKETKDLIKSDIISYNKLLKLGFCGEVTEEIKSYIQNLELIKKWLDARMLENGKKCLINQGNIDLEQIKQKEIERRKKILAENKLQNMKEKQAQEEELNSKMLEPISTNALLKQLKDADHEIKIYRDQVIPEGVFIDPLFPAEIKSLCPVDEEGDFVLPKGCEEQDIDGFENYEFTNFYKIFGNNNYQVFLDGIEENDVIQGGLGDCYFLSAITALCKFPELIEGLFLFTERSEENCYGVKFRINGRWKIILLDDQIPGDGGVKPNFACSLANGNELWVVLLEKAWAKICGNFAKVCAGLPTEVFDCITNSISENIDCSHENAEEIWIKLKDAKEKNFIMTAGTGNDPSIDYDSVNLVVGHAYTCLDSYEVVKSGIKVKLIKLRNPWGNSEFSGDWSDSSNLWTPALKKELDVTERDDGVFFMSFDDFLTYFVIFSICKIYPKFTNNVVKIEKENTLTPVVHICQIKTKAKYFFQAHQKNPRFQLKDGTYAINSIIHLMILDKDKNFIKSKCTDYHVEGFEVDLDPGKYYIVSDVSYRYIDRNKLHSYTVSCLGLEPGVFFSTDEKFNDVISKGLASYAFDTIQPILHKGSEEFGGVEIYNQTKIIPEFPYVFCVINNKTPFICVTSYKIRDRGGREYEFFDAPQQLDMLKEIPSKQNYVFCVRRFFPDSSVENSTSVFLIYSDQVLEKLIKDSKEESKKIDKSGAVTMKQMKYDAGYGLLFKNDDPKIEFHIHISFELSNLKITSHPDESVIDINIEPKSTKFFNLKAIDPTAKTAFGISYHIST